jgi:signal transduction histidine kinase
MTSLKLGRMGQIALMAAALALLSWGAMAVSRQKGVAVLWPMDALAVAVCIRWAREFHERAIVVAAAGVSMMVGNVLWGSPLWLAVALPLFNTVEIAGSVWLVMRIGRPIDNPRAFAAYVAGPILAMPVITAAGASTLFYFVPGGDPFDVFVHWAFATGLGMAIVGSFALTVGRRGSRPMRAPDWRRFVLAQILVLAGCSYILMQTRPPALFLLAPFLVLGAMSNREFGGVTSIILTAVVAVVATLAGRGPALIADLASVDRIMLMQVLLAGMVFTVLPISALLRRLDVYQAELEERRAKAEELNALKTRLLAYVSHEIRSPLSGVTSLAELLRDGHLGALTGPQREALDQITASGAEVDALARDLTDTAAIESGKASVRLERVRVGEAIAAAANIARFRTSQHAAVLETQQGEADEAHVMADPLRLRQILVNLMVNGAKYGGSPPLVRVVARPTAAGALRFEVSDNGAGIPPAQRAALFGAFERLGQEKSDVEGAGLGLALSREMARAQGGQMGVEDSDLGGMRFWLELPLAGSLYRAA